MVLVPGGEYLSGDPDFGGLRPWSVDAFYIDRTEVTVDAYERCVTAGACTPPGTNDDCTAESLNWGKPDRANHPINCVSFERALTYCNWLGKRLPAKDEWEKAARGTDGRTYPWGEQRPSCRRAVTKECTAGITAPVGSRTAGASPYGIFDMAGNVNEIVLSRNMISYHMRRRTLTVAGMGSGERGSARGGSIRNEARSTDLETWTASGHYENDGDGFRCAATADPPIP